MSATSAVKVPFLDLGRQFAAIAEELEQAVLGVVRSGQYVLGENLAALEAAMAAYCGTAFGVGVGSGTDALMLSLEALGIGPGDEVVTSPFTFVATAEVISRIGATPVFADIDPSSYNLDPAEVVRRLTSRTRAVIPVHLYGQPVDMDPLLAVAAEHGLAVIEDAAQAVGAAYKGRRVGSIGRVGCFSFFPTKNLGGMGDGGLVTTDDAQVADRLRMLRHHGSRRRYIHERLGWCSRLDEIQAAVLRVKLSHLDAWTEKRRALAHAYSEGLRGTPLQLPTERDGDHVVYHLYTVGCSARDALVAHLVERGIGAMVHYPMPLHHQPIYEHLRNESLPHSAAAAQRVLSLPLFPELTLEEIEVVVTAVHDFYGTERSAA